MALAARVLARGIGWSTRPCAPVGPLPLALACPSRTAATQASATRVGSTAARAALSSSASPPAGTPDRGHWFAGAGLAHDFPHDGEFSGPAVHLTQLAEIADARVVVVTRRDAKVEVLVQRGTDSPVWAPSALPAAEWRDAVSDAIFVGVSDEGKHYWAVEVEERPAGGDGGWPPAPQGGVWAPARALVGLGPHHGSPMTQFDASVAGRAVALCNWRRETRFCGRTGEDTSAVAGAGWREAPGGHRIYPRVDPAVIMAVVSKDSDHVLLGQARSMRGTRYMTCLAGFVGPGESAEDACRRETREETGVAVGRVVLHSTQPWPIGRAGGCELMIGCVARAVTEVSAGLRVDPNELAAARWAPRDEVAAALAAASAPGPVNPSARHGDGLAVPGPNALAHHLLRAFVDGYSDHV